MFWEQNRNLRENKPLDNPDFTLIITERVNQTIACTLHEESPGSTGRGCQITSGVGNYRESATETFRRNG